MSLTVWRGDPLITACRDATGRHLLAFTTGYVYRVEIPSATFTRLPFPQGQPYTAAW